MPIVTRDIVLTGVPNNLGIVIEAKALLDFEPALRYLASHGKRPRRIELYPCNSGKRYKDCHGVLS